MLRNYPAEKCNTTLNYNQVARWPISQYVASGRSNSTDVINDGDPTASPDIGIYVSLDHSWLPVLFELIVTNLASVSMDMSGDIARGGTMCGKGCCFVIGRSGNKQDNVV